jgi:hypothetical protein
MPQNWRERYVSYSPTKPEMSGFFGLERINVAFRRDFDEVAIEILPAQGLAGNPLGLHQGTLGKPCRRRRGETSDGSAGQRRKPRDHRRIDHSGYNSRAKLFEKRPAACAEPTHEVQEALTLAAAGPGAGPACQCMRFVVRPIPGLNALQGPASYSAARASALRDRDGQHCVRPDIRRRADRAIPSSALRWPGNHVPSPR